MASFAIGLILGFLGGITLTVCWLGYGLYRMLVSYYAEAQARDKDIEPIIHGDGQMWVADTHTHKQH
jgi:hypothetical protein